MPRPGRTIFVPGGLVDGTGSEPVKDIAVVVEGGKIAEVISKGSLTRGPDDEVVEAEGCTLIAGLIDCHCHVAYLCSEDFGQPIGVTLIANAINNARAWLMRGVTTARELCTRDNLDIDLRDAINRGLVLGPRLLVSGEGMAMTGGKQKGYDQLVTEVTGADEARRFVRRQFRAGVDHIKIFATAGLTDGGQPQLTEEEIRAAVEEAHKAGGHVAAHAIGTEGIKIALRAGVDTIEHGTFLDEEGVDLMLSTGITFVPTLSIGRTMADAGEEIIHSPALRENARNALESARESARMAYKAGVPMATGTDPVYGDTLAMECRELVDIGLTPMEALQAATIAGARILGLEDQIGTVEPGKYADLVLVEGNPLEDISALERIRYVVKEGVVVRTPETVVPDLGFLAGAQATVRSKSDDPAKEAVV